MVVVLLQRMRNNVINREMNDGSPVVLYFPARQPLSSPTVTFHLLLPETFSFHIALPLVLLSPAAHSWDLCCYFLHLKTIPFNFISFSCSNRTKSKSQQRWHARGGGKNILAFCHAPGSPGMDEKCFIAPGNPDIPAVIAAAG